MQACPCFPLFVRSLRCKHSRQLKTRKRTDCSPGTLHISLPAPTNCRTNLTSIDSPPASQWRYSRMNGQDKACRQHNPAARHNIQHCKSSSGLTPKATDSLRNAGIPPWVVPPIRGQHRSSSRTQGGCWTTRREHCRGTQCMASLPPRCHSCPPSTCRPTGSSIREFPWYVRGKPDRVHLRVWRRCRQGKGCK